MFRNCAIVSRRSVATGAFVVASHAKFTGVGVTPVEPPAPGPPLLPVPELTLLPVPVPVLFPVPVPVVFPVPVPELLPVPVPPAAPVPCAPPCPTHPPARIARTSGATYAGPARIRAVRPPAPRKRSSRKEKKKQRTAATVTEGGERPFLVPSPPWGRGFGRGGPR